MNILSSILSPIGIIIPEGRNMGRLDTGTSHFRRQKMKVHFLAAIQPGTA